MRLEGARIQSAMEYLMTYGWAILAIAIVMVSLYSLGIFTTGNLQPTATPGSCEVVRTTAQTSLSGQCSNLIPKYVGKFNGGSSYVDAGYVKINGLASGTFEAWINTEPVQHTDYSLIVGSRNAAGQLSDMEFHANVNSILFILWNGVSGPGISYSSTSFYGTWHQVIGTWSGGTMSLYVDGIFRNSTSFTGSLYTTQNTYIGYDYVYGADRYFNGSIADVQIYNTSLDNASVKVLYREGIGGAPVDVQHLVGWWPLNGNANDYSGNNNQGTPTNVNWNANWQSGYTAPTT